jgi:outer membrane protein
MNTKRYFILSALLLLGLFTTFPAITQQLMTLEQALGEAGMKSPSIRQARLSLEQSRENLIAQRAALKSRFSLNLTPFQYNRNRNYSETLGEWITSESTSASGTFLVSQPIALTDGTVTLSNNLGWQDSYSSFSNNNQFRGFSNNVAVRVDQPIFTYNRKKMELRQVELALENSQMNYAMRMLSVEQSVTMAFYEVHQAQQGVNIAREEYQNRKMSYEIIKNKVEAGLSAREEFFQAELDLLSSQSSLYNREVTLENTMDRFKELLGLPLDDEIIVLAEVNVNPVDVNLKNAIDQALSSRMELRQREIAIEEGFFTIIRTEALNEFKGNIGVAVGLFGENPNLANVYENPTNNRNVSFSFDIPLFDWGEKKARLRSVQAAQEARIFDLEDERISISLSIRQIARNLVNLQNQIEIARKNEENANLTYDINLEKYKNGDLTSMDLNLVQNQLTQQKQNLTNALIQYKLELLNLKIQTLYDFENDLPIVHNFSQYNLR